MSLASARVFSAERPTTTTCSPALASVRAAAAPMPSLAPVITMVRGVKGCPLLGGKRTRSGTPKGTTTAGRQVFPAPPWAAPTGFRTTLCPTYSLFWCYTSYLLQPATSTVGGCTPTEEASCNPYSFPPPQSLGTDTTP